LFLRKKYLDAIILFVFLFAIFININIQAETDHIVREDQYGNLRLENDYIAIVVNQDQNSQGRFAVETTGGAPLKDEDENMPLIYGRPQPWPSYTTIRIDGENYVFGGSTERRAGRDGIYGEVITPPRVVDNEKIITRTDFEGIIVEQVLSFEKGVTTGLEDSVRIEYNIENNRSTEHNVGIRIMLDTMLGENDGAPFRVREEIIDTDTTITTADLPQYWQAFDSIASPTVISQGTFEKPELTLPDEVYFSDWGSLADGVWDFNFNPGQEFWRAGEYEIDSAMAMYWNPQTLAPGEEVSYATEYGLGGVEVVPGLISLADSSPAEAVFDRPEYTFPIIIYIENDSDIVLQDVTLDLSLPDSFYAEDLSRQLGDFEPGEVNQVVWDVGAAISIDELPGEMEFNVVADAANTDPNELSRAVNIIGPPEIQSHIESEALQADHGIIEPNPFRLNLELYNTGGSTFENMSLNVDLPPGIQISGKDRTSKYVGELRPEEQVDVSWRLEVIAGLFGENIPISINLKGHDDYTQYEIYEIDIPEISPTVYFEQKRAPESSSSYQVIDIMARNIENVEEIDLNLSYDPDNMKAIRVLPGSIFVQGRGLVLWDEVNLYTPGSMRIIQTLPQMENLSPYAVLASIIFRVEKEEEISLNWRESIFIDDSGDELKVNLLDLN